MKKGFDWQGKRMDQVNCANRIAFIGIVGGSALLMAIIAYKIFSVIY